MIIANVGDDAADIYIYIALKVVVFCRPSDLTSPCARIAKTDFLFTL